MTFFFLFSFYRGAKVNRPKRNQKIIVQSENKCKECLCIFMLPISSRILIQVRSQSLRVKKEQVPPFLVGESQLWEVM